jgi:hypothetical protein
MLIGQIARNIFWKTTSGNWKPACGNYIYSTAKEKEDSKCLVRFAVELQWSFVKKGELKNISKSYVPSGVILILQQHLYLCDILLWDILL